MSVNFQQLAPILAACMTTGGIIFQIGKQSEKLDILGMKVEAQEKRESINNQSICEILGSINILKNDVTYIKEDVHDIKGYMGKVR